MSIDYTQDFSGVFKRDTLEMYLVKNKGFLQNGEECEDDKRPRIINCEKECGRNIVKYVKSEDSMVCVVKFYNKIVSNFEAGDTQKKMGSHLAEYTFTHSNDHLEKTFRHPDVIERGLTRLELSVHGFDFNTNYASLLEKEFNLVKDTKIFHIQPGSEQWLRLAKNISKWSLISCKPSREMVMCWYGSSLTKRIAGVTIKISKEHLEENLEEWEHAKRWVISNFGLLIYDVEIDGRKEKVVNTRKKKDENQKRGRPLKKQEEERRRRLTEEERREEDCKRKKRREQRKKREAKKRLLSEKERQ